MGKSGAIKNVKSKQNSVKLQSKENIAECRNSDEQRIQFLVQGQVEEILKEVDEQIDEIEETLKYYVNRSAKSRIQTDYQESKLNPQTNTTNCINGFELKGTKNDVEVLWNNINPFDVHNCETKSTKECTSKDDGGPQNHIAKSSTKMLVNEGYKVAQSTVKTHATIGNNDSQTCRDKSFPHSRSKFAEPDNIGQPKLSSIIVSVSKENKLVQLVSSSGLELRTTEKDSTIYGHERIDCSVPNLLKVDYNGCLDKSSTNTIVNNDYKRGQIAPSCIHELHTIGKDSTINGSIPNLSKLDYFRYLHKSSTNTLVNYESNRAQLVQSNGLELRTTERDNTIYGHDSLDCPLPKLSKIDYLGFLDKTSTNTLVNNECKTAQPVPSNDIELHTIGKDYMLDCSLPNLSEVNYNGNLDKSSTNTQQLPSNRIDLLKADICANTHLNPTSLNENEENMIVVGDAMTEIKNNAKQSPENSQRNRTLSLSISYDKMESVNINVTFQRSNKPPQVNCAPKTDANISRIAEHTGSDVNVHIALQNTNACDHIEGSGENGISTNERQHCNIRLALDSSEPPATETAVDIVPNKETISDNSTDSDLNMHFSLKSPTKPTADAAKRSGATKSKKCVTTSTAVLKKQVAQPFLAAIPKKILEDMYVCLVHDGRGTKRASLSKTRTDETPKKSSIEATTTKSLLKNMSPNVNNEESNLKRCDDFQYYNTVATATTSGRWATPTNVQFKNSKLPRARLRQTKAELPMSSNDSRNPVKYPVMKRLGLSQVSSRQALSTRKATLPQKPVDAITQFGRLQRRIKKLYAQPQTKSEISSGSSANAHPAGQQVEANENKSPLPSAHGAGDA